jgi:hypothetical protein
MNGVQSMDRGNIGIMLDAETGGLVTDGRMGCILFLKNEE